MRYALPPMINPVIKVESSIYAWSIGKFLILVGSLIMIVVFAASMVLTYKVTSSYLNQAYARNAQIRALAQAHEISQILVAARNDLDYLANGPLTIDKISRHFEAMAESERRRYREVAFQGPTSEERFIVVLAGSGMVPVPLDQAVTSGTGVFSTRDKVEGKSSDYVHIGDPVEVTYPSVPGPGGMRAVTMNVIRLSKPIYSASNEYQGQLTLSVDLSRLRDILSVHSSIQSPLFLFPQESEQKKSFFFDNAGWLLFQSESPEDQGKELSVDLLRYGLQGDVGRPGFNSAFRPGFEHNLYWAMVSDVQSGISGQTSVARPFMAPETTDRPLYLSYVAIVFQESSESKRVVGGIGCIDASFVFMSSTYHVAGLLSLCFGLGVILIFLTMFFISRRICRPLNQLALAIEGRAAGDDPSPVALSPLFAEIDQFQKSINILLLQLQIARSDTLLREGLDEDDRMRQLVNLDREIRSASDLDPQLLAMPLYGIVGGSQAVANLRQHIHKAARVLADVLIIGETGTGKELTAEAIHSVSHRAKGPFLSINCGALDENLLMDALFGHIKGAFSEAQSDRQGAFIAASGGTLHLDEIGNASPKVQQALLRALSVRRIRPLGADKDVAFDARIIAATNIDLMQLALTGTFREDLFYRLAVITINTPPLRQRKEDIPVLIKHFFEEYTIRMGREPAGISRGALEKLLHHNWPGNIRELKNCLTRSLAFAEDELLLAQHILFDEGAVESVPQDQQLREPLTSPLVPAGNGEPERTSGDKVESRITGRDSMPCELNTRQQKAWPVIARQGGISRSEYQQAVGEAISTRTAQYDLLDLVHRGLLKKFGRGPASRYLIVQNQE